MTAPANTAAPTYRGEAERHSGLSLAACKLSKWRDVAVVYASRPGGCDKPVYRRRCLNATHAQRVADNMASRFQAYFDRTGKRWEDRAAIAKATGATP